MQTDFEQLKNHKAGGQKDDFLALVRKMMPQVERYVRHRIKTAEAKGLLPLHFYAAADVLADIYLRIYRDFDRIASPRQLKVELFRLADEIIQSYIDRENRITKRVPVDKLLAEEMKILEEKITANADGEPVLIEELDDISYHQDEFKPKIYLFDKTAEEDFARSLGLQPDDFLNEKFRSIFGSIYGQLPETVRRILDLVSVGGLSPDETAEVLRISAGEVNRVLEGIRLQIIKNR